MSVVREGARQMVRLLEKFPEERIKHMVSFKQTQLDRFKRVAGMPVKGDNTAGRDGSNVEKLSMNEVKDILNRTKGPLGLQKEDIKKIQAAIPRDQFTEQSIKSQIRSLESLMNNKYRDYYDVGDKLYKPAGNPKYYQRLLGEISGTNKETFVTAMRTIFFGK